MLKSDFHLHSNEDWHDGDHITYSAKDMIRAAQKMKFEVLSLTHHNHVYFNNEIRSFAKKRGILLIPGAEVRIQRKDVLLVNVKNDEIRDLRHLEDLDRIKDHALIIAPHPYFVLGPCLKGLLEKHIRRFHAIEFGHFYAKPFLYPALKFIDGNTKAVRIARKYNKPLVGTSDAHRMYDFGRTFSWVAADKTKDDVLEAIKKRRIHVDSKPLAFHNFFRRAASLVLKERVRRYMRGNFKDMPDVAVDPNFRRR